MNAGHRPAADVLTEGEDRSTLDYFDEHLIEYEVPRLDYMAQLIRERASTGANLADVGCGVGNTLAHLSGETGLESVVGIDISPRCLEKTEELLGCETLLGSVLDDDFVASIEARFDFVVMTAILHHLIGPSRAASLENAESGLQNGVRLLKPGGYLMVLEPVYGPRPMTATVFWMKKLVTALTTSRIELGSSWANIGPPVVSYLSSRQLVEMARRTPGASLDDVHEERINPPFLMRLLLRHGETTVTLRRETEAA